MFLVILDSCSKWPELYQMTSTTAVETVERFRDYFARFGLADVIVSDNGPQFIADAFKVFCNRNGIKTITTAAYKPQSNGAAENAVKSFKNGITKAVLDPKNARTSLQTVISRYLYFYRSSVHASYLRTTTTGETPYQLMFGRPMRTHFDRLKSTTLNEVIKLAEKRIEEERATSEAKQAVKENPKTDHGTPTKSFKEGDVVMVKVYGQDKKSSWGRATVIKQLGVNIFIIKPTKLAFFGNFSLNMGIGFNSQFSV